MAETEELIETSPSPDGNTQRPQIDPEVLRKAELFDSVSMQLETNPDEALKRIAKIYQRDIKIVGEEDEEDEEEERPTKPEYAFPIEDDDGREVVDPKRVKAIVIDTLNKIKQEETARKSRVRSLIEQGKQRFRTQYPDFTTYEHVFDEVIAETDESVLESVTTMEQLEYLRNRAFERAARAGIWGAPPSQQNPRHAPASSGGGAKPSAQQSAEEMLTPGELRMAQAAGMTPEEYLKYKKEANW